MTYPHHIIEVARKLRQTPTPAEKLLWEKLRNRKLAGLKFARQHPFGRYVVDFYCAELKLIIELEGVVHEKPMQKEYDENRFAELKNRGLRILRVRNEDALNKTEELMKRILEFRKTLTPHPLSRVRERGAHAITTIGVRVVRVQNNIFN